MQAIFGQCDKKRVPRVVHTAVTLALLSGVFLLDVLGQFVAHPILVLMGAPKEYHSSGNFISENLFSWNAVFYVV